MSDNDAGLAVATVALVPAIFGAALPSLADVRRDPDDDGTTGAAIRTASLVSAAAVLGVAAITGSSRVLAIGAVAVVAYAGVYGHARGVQPWAL